MTGVQTCALPIYLGDIISVRSNFYQVQGKFKIVEIVVKNTGARMDLACVDVSDLLARDQFFIVGQSYNNSDSKFLSL